MAKRSKRKKKAVDGISQPVAFAPKESRSKSIFQTLLSGVWAPLLLAVATFLVYWPSLKSGLVYDARKEILEEGFITSIANLPYVLSLKVLGMHLMLGSRPGQMLYLMLIAALCGKAPFGYHLCGNLLHAANVALLFVLLRKLITMELPGLTGNGFFKAQLAAVAVTLIFALHPITVEPVSAVNFSSDLLVTFFTLLALLAATSFRPDNFRAALLTGAAGTVCAFAAVTCKESGIAAAATLIVYWFLFRRGEPKRTWLWFLGAATALTAIFLAARFFFAPPSEVNLTYLGGSFSQVFLIQPRLWVFMMGKLLWPVQFSADYTLENASGISTFVALVILVVVLLLQAWLASKSRIGAFGVAFYWLGLMTVSNFIPLFRILADRFYYLPLAGVAMQLLALLLMTLKSRRGFWMAVAPFLAVILPLTALTLTRQDVFANEFSFWSDTVQASPFSSIANYNLGTLFAQKGQVDESIAQYLKALAIDSNYADAHYNLGVAFFQKEQVDEAIGQYQKALGIKPNYADVHNNLGVALLKKGQVDEAIDQYQKALEIDPKNADAHTDLGNALLKKGRVDEAIDQYQKALEIAPNFAKIHYNLGVALFQKGEIEKAIARFQEAVRLNPNDINWQANLAKARAMARQGAPQHQ